MCLIFERNQIGANFILPPPFRRASGLLLKAVHDYEHVHVNVGRGVNTPGPLTKPVVVDVLVAVDGF